MRRTCARAQVEGPLGCAAGNKFNIMKCLEYINRALDGSGRLVLALVFAFMAIAVLMWRVDHPPMRQKDVLVISTNNVMTLPVTITITIR